MIKAASQAKHRARLGRMYRWLQRCGRRAALHSRSASFCSPVWAC